MSDPRAEYFRIVSLPPGEEWGEQWRAWHHRYGTREPETPMELRSRIERIDLDLPQRIASAYVGQPDSAVLESHARTARRHAARLHASARDSIDRPPFAVADPATDLENIRLWCLDTEGILSAFWDEQLISIPDLTRVMSRNGVRVHVTTVRKWLNKHKVHIDEREKAHRVRLRDAFHVMSLKSAKYPGLLENLKEYVVQLKHTQQN